MLILDMVGCSGIVDFAFVRCLFTYGILVW